MTKIDTGSKFMTAVNITLKTHKPGGPLRHLYQIWYRGRYWSAATSLTPNFISDKIQDGSGRHFESLYTKFGSETKSGD